MTAKELLNVLQSTYKNNNIIVGSYVYAIHENSNLIEYSFYIVIMDKSYFLYDLSGNQLPLNSAIGFYFNLNLFSLKDNIFKSINIANVSQPQEFYDTASIFYLFDNKGNVIDENFYGLKIFCKDTFALFTKHKNNTYSQVDSYYNIKVDENGSIVQTDNKVSEDCNYTEYILKQICSSSGNDLPVYINNKKSKYFYWKSLMGVDIFIKDGTYYVLTNDKLCPLYNSIILWNHGANKYSLVSRDRRSNSDDIDFIKLRIVACSKNELIHEDFIETKSIPNYVFFERIFLSKDYLIFSRGERGLIILDKFGNTTFKSSNSAPFVPDGFSGDYLYTLSKYSICLYDVNGQNVANESVIYCGASPNLIPRLSNWDQYLITKSISAGTSKFGVASVHYAKRILPNSFDKIIVIHSDIHSDETKVGYGNDKYCFYAELRASDRATICGVFAPQGIIIPFGKYSTIIPLYYVDEKEEYRVKNAEDAWHTDRAWYERSKSDRFSGWFLCIDKFGKTLLQYYDKNPISILGFISVIHPISISLFIEVETESGKGILSPFGWVVPPARKYIQKFSTDGSDLNFGSARNFQNWVVFRIDNDIIRIKSKTIKQEDGYTESFCNEIALEYLFESKDVYEFMSYHPASFGINFYYRKISDNSKLGINVFCASASIVKPYSELRDYNIIGNYTDKDNPWQIDDFSDGRQILLNRDNF